MVLISIGDGTHKVQHDPHIRIKQGKGSIDLMNIVCALELTSQNLRDACNYPEASQ